MAAAAEVFPACIPFCLTDVVGHSSLGSGQRKGSLSHSHLGPYRRLCDCTKLAVAAAEVHAKVVALVLGCILLFSVSTLFT